MGRAQQHSGVRIVAAGVHHAGVLRFIRRVRFLQDGQGVHVGADGDGRPAAGAHLAHHAGAPDAGFDVNAQLGERVGYKCGRSEFLEPKFGMGVDVAPQADEFVV